MARRQDGKGAKWKDACRLATLPFSHFALYLRWDEYKIDRSNKPMPNRYRDWFRQAKKDLEHAKNSLENGDYEWACFASQQAVEKAIKAIYQKIGADAWGHSVNILLANLPDEVNNPD